MTFEQSLANIEEPDARIDPLWAQEAEIRIAAHDAGLIESFDADEVMTESLTWTGILSSDPEVMGCALVFKGTRVPFQTLIDHGAAGDSLDVFLDDFPSVSREQAAEALSIIEAERQPNQTALMSETALSNWNRPEEEAA